jgi:hypothetical protein
VARDFFYAPTALGAGAAAYLRLMIERPAWPLLQAALASVAGASRAGGWPSYPSKPISW